MAPIAQRIEHQSAEDEPGMTFHMVRGSYAARSGPPTYYGTQLTTRATADGERHGSVHQLRLERESGWGKWWIVEQYCIFSSLYCTLVFWTTIIEDWRVLKISVTGNLTS